MTRREFIGTGAMFGAAAVAGQTAAAQGATGMTARFVSLSKRGQDEVIARHRLR